MSFFSTIEPPSSSKQPFSEVTRVQSTFDRAAESPNGFGGVRKIIRQSDVTIYSDKHSESATIYKDMLSPEKLKAYQADGVKDIYVEDHLNNGPIAKAYAEGRITKEQALDKCDSNGKLAHLSPEAARQQRSDLLDAYANAKKEGINIHFAQWPMTEPQNEEINGGISKIHEKVANSLINSANKVSGGKGSLALTTEENEALFGKDISDSFNMSLSTKDRLAAQERFVKGLHQHLGAKLSPKEIIDLTKEVNDQYIAQLKLQPGRNIAIMQFRIDNDITLSDYIAQSKTPGGRAIVIHGRLHGAQDHKDLDDQLAKRGLRTARIDIDYKGEKDPVAGKDPTPHRYSPNKGSDGTFTVDPSVKSSGFKEPDPTAIVTPESPRPGSNQPPGYGR